MSEPKYTDLMATLHADHPAGDRADKLQLYGPFVGDWDADIVAHGPDGARHDGRGEIHFGWILEGRAVQDAWIAPRIRDRRPDQPQLPIAGDWCGTTIRVYDPALDAWRIYWIDPATNSYRQQIGRRRGMDIVQEGEAGAGALSRWSFPEIAPNAFHWKGEVSADRASSWRLAVEVFARRSPGSA